MPKTRPPYPEEFCREAVELVRGGRAIPDVASSLGVTEQSLRNWVKSGNPDLTHYLDFRIIWIVAGAGRVFASFAGEPVRIILDV